MSEPIIKDEFLEALKRINIPGSGQPGRPRRTPPPPPTAPTPVRVPVSRSGAPTKPVTAGRKISGPANLCVPEDKIRQLHATAPAERQRLKIVDNGQEVGLLTKLCTCDKPVGCACRDFYNALDIEVRRSSDMIG